MADASVRQRLVKTLPEYAGIDPVPTNNAPTVPQGDGEKAAWDRQVRVVQSLVVTLYLVIGQDKAVDAMEAEYSPNEVFKLLFSFFFGFVERHRRLKKTGGGPKIQTG